MRKEPKHNTKETIRLQRKREKKKGNREELQKQPENN